LPRGLGPAGRWEGQALRQFRAQPRRGKAKPAAHPPSPRPVECRMGNIRRGGNHPC
jgi:hypothetical protein